MSLVTAPAQVSIALIASSGNAEKLSASTGYKKMVFSPIAVLAERF